MNYIARCKCGSIVAAASMDIKDKNDLIKEMANWIKDGLAIETVEPDVVRREFARCKCPE